MWACMFFTGVCACACKNHVLSFPPGPLPFSLPQSTRGNMVGLENMKEEACI